MARLLHAGSDRLAEGLGDTALAVDGKLDATKLDAAARIDIAKAEILDHRNAVARRLLKAFPNMRPAEHEALEQLKSWVEEKKCRSARAGGKGNRQKEVKKELYPT